MTSLFHLLYCFHSPDIDNVDGFSNKIILCQGHGAILSPDLSKLLSSSYRGFDTKNATVWLISPRISPGGVITSRLINIWPHVTRSREQTRLLKTIIFSQLHEIGTSSIITIQPSMSKLLTDSAWEMAEDNKYIKNKVSIWKHNFVLRVKGLKPNGKCNSLFIAFRAWLKYLFCNI